MAYRTPIDLTCYVSGCSKRATWKVVNRYNAECGVYCATHAKSKEKELQRAEDDAWKRQTQP